MNCGAFGIDYDRYFNQDCSLVRVTASDSKYSANEVSEETLTIKVRISGGDKFYRNSDDQISVAERVYKTLFPVRLGDILNGQSVVHVKTIYEFDGSLAFYKVYV